MEVPIHPRWLMHAIAVTATMPLVTLLVGCGSPPAPNGLEAFVPPLEQARSCLSASLQAWRDGHPDGPVNDSGVSVEASDSERVAGRHLRDFEILGPIGTDERRTFAVRLKLDDPAEERVERYLVMGQNPVWVFRLEDYERISHWEHKMEEEEDEELEASESTGSAHDSAHHHDTEAGVLPTEPPDSAPPLDQPDEETTHPDDPSQTPEHQP